LFNRYFEINDMSNDGTMLAMPRRIHIINECELSIKEEGTKKNSLTF